MVSTARCRAAQDAQNALVFSERTFHCCIPFALQSICICPAKKAFHSFDVAISIRNTMRMWKNKYVLLKKKKKNNKKTKQKTNKQTNDETIPLCMYSPISIAQTSMARLPTSLFKLDFQSLQNTSDSSRKQYHYENTPIQIY